MDKFITGLDVLFVLTLILSGLWGYMRGLVKEIFAIFAWVGAAVATKYGSLVVEPSIAEVIGKGGESTLFSQAVTYIILFLIFFVLFSIISKKFSKRMEASEFEGLDKTLGFLFGIIRGIVVIALIYMFFIWLFAEEDQRPDWIKKARSRPILRVTSQVLTELFLPGEFEELDEDIKEGKDNKDQTYNRLSRPEEEKRTLIDSEAGYNNSERRELDKQINQLQELDF